MTRPEPRKQTTTVSATRLREQLVAAGYEADYYTGQRPAPRPTEKAAVKAAEALFGRNVVTSKGGHMVAMSFNQISVDVPVKGMIGHGALAAIEQRTGLTFKS